MPFVAGVLFSIAAGAAALGNYVVRPAAATAPRRGRVIAGSAAAAAVGALLYAVAPTRPGCCRRDTALRRRDGRGDDGGLHAPRARVIPATARGASFGLLSTASLAGLAVSPIVSGFLGATSIRAVFLLDAVALVSSDSWCRG